MKKGYLGFSQCFAMAWSVIYASVFLIEFGEHRASTNLYSCCSFKWEPENNHQGHVRCLHMPWESPEPLGLICLKGSSSLSQYFSLKKQLCTQVIHSSDSVNISDLLIVNTLRVTLPKILT